jgi:hypothetical protein
MLEWLTKTKYTRFLEAEVERLRAERDEARKQNWALLNPLVTTAGAPLPQEMLRSAESASAKAAARQSPDQPKPVIRRRSWQQVARALELRNRPPSDTAKNGSSIEKNGTA